MKNEESLTSRITLQLKPSTNGTNGSRGNRSQGYTKLIARRCAHKENNNNNNEPEPERPVPDIHQNGKSRSAFPKITQSQSTPSSPTKTYRPCCASSSTPSSKNSEKFFTNSEPSSPRRKARVLLRQSAVRNSKESISNSYHDNQHKHENHEKLLPNRININIAKIPNRVITTSKIQHPLSINSNTITTITATNTQRKSQKCNGNNGHGNGTTNANTSGGKVLRDQGSFTISKSIEVGHQRQRRGPNGHANNNMATIPINKDVKKAEMESYSKSQRTVLKPSCISTSPSKPQLNIQLPRKRLQDIRPISTTTTTITYNNISTGPGTTTASPSQEQDEQQGRKLISRETTILFLNGHGKNTKQTQESRQIITNLTSCSSLANRTNGNSKCQNASKTSNSSLGPTSKTTKPSFKSVIDTGKMENGHINGDEINSKGQSPVLEILQPLESNLEFLEGSDFELTVKIQGAKKVVWVKNDQIVPNIPPDFEYKSNLLDGTFSLKIQDAFLEDSGLYICEAYGSDEESDAICWCRVDVIEGDDEDDTSIEEVPEPEPTRRFIVPLIITSDASEDPSHKIMEPKDSAENKRLMFKEIRDISTNSSRDIFEDALDTLVDEQRNIRNVDHIQQDHNVTEHQDQDPNSDEDLCYSQTEELLDGDNSDIALSMSPSELHTAVNQFQLNPIYVTDNESIICDSISSSPEEHKPLNLTYNVLNENNFSSEVGDLTTHSAEMSFDTTLSDKVEDADISRLSTPGSQKYNVVATNSQLNREIETQLSFSDDSDQSLSPSKNFTIFDTTPEIEPESISFSEIDKEFNETLGTTDMSLDSTKTSEELDIRTSHFSLETSETLQHDFNQTKGSEDMSFGTISEVPELETSNCAPEEDQIIRSPPAFEKTFTTQSSTDSSCGSEAFNCSSLDEAMLSSIDQSSPEMGGHAPSTAHFRQLQSRDSLSLTDQLPPRILIGPSNLIAILGETVNLRVKIQSTDEVNTKIGWCKFVRGIYRRLGTRSESEEAEDPSAHIQIKKVNRDLITLSINDVNYEDSGKYRVKIENLYGIDYHHCILSVEGPPEAPSTPPKAKYDQASNCVLISWHSCPYDGGCAVTGYRLEASFHPVDNSNGAENENSWTVLTPPSFKWLCFTLESPLPVHIYRFRVSVENAYGKGRPSVPSKGLVINLQSDTSGVTSVGSVNPDRTVSLNYKYNHTFECTDPVHQYKNVSLKNEPFLQYYDKFEQLGKGRFGVVFKVMSKATKKMYAGKFVKCIKSKDKERAQLECEIMNELKYHPKLICLADAFEMPREIVIVTEVINGGELFERVVADDFTLTENDCIAFLRQICDGVNYIHEKNIMHLDLKPENILCTTKTSNQIKIIDFGLAQHYNPKAPISVLFGTAEFVSPEIINYDTICPATDMWSIGVITYILLSGLSPFLGDNDNETFSNITRGEFDFEDDAFDNISDDAKDFISSLIIKRKEKRLTARQCLQHQWLALSDAEKKGIVLPTEKLKRFLLRRKWQKTGNAIRALGRITTLYSSRKSSSASSSTSSSPLGSFMNRNLSNQDSIEYDSVFSSLEVPLSPDTNICSNPLNNNLCSGSNTVVSSPTSKTKPVETDLLSEHEETNKPKYNDNSRSDSGVCDVASLPVTPTPQE